ncbi:Fur family transcriptional regulator [Parvularcula oceani]|uniref:Fur family transcriptional regulator n=1 Tax=Parvularcula oceani TaxID=1247963 RepID=UPI000691902D|nr:Fur family transcriptional regulator [Parvularcula oceani]
MAERSDLGVATDVTAAGESQSPSLSRNEKLVLETLDGSKGPLKAYDLLGQLKAQGVNAPMTVYRALDRLESRGLVHKLDGLGAFVVCNHDGPHMLQAFFVCLDCGSVEEVVEGRYQAALPGEEVQALAAGSGFAVASARLEIRGRCRNCG